MTRLKVVSVVGTRPNFMKTAPVVSAMRKRPDQFESVLVHTGQHYDSAMSDIFFRELNVGRPDHMLEVGSGSHGAQTAEILTRMEDVLEAEQPDLVLVPGDVNSTLAAALAAVKMGITVGHIESGLRSFDRTMPEEINRIMTDSISDLLFTHSPEAAVNLAAEGRPTDAIHPVGNTMIDTLETLKSGFDPSTTLSRLQLEPGSYLMVTLHRPALVDGPLLQTAVEALNNVARFMPVVFPVHPRTAARIESLPVNPTAGLHLTEPLGYLEFMGLVQQSAAVLTDSGGVQEETTVLGVPCFTLRSNTERPITVSEGTNMLLGLEPERIRDLPNLIAEVSRSSTAKIPSGWDGLASERLVDVLESSIVPRSR